MPKLALHYAPSACCDATLIALEHVGVPFDLHLLRFMKGEHRAPDYLTLNPKGKVPLLVIDGRPLTENVAIMTFLARTFPDSKLLPFGDGEFEDAKILSDLAWVASGLHPLVNRIFLPFLTCDIEGAPTRVREIASEQMKPNLAILEDRLTDRDWWYRDWSALDGYLFWVYNRLDLAGFDLEPFPRYRDHAARMHTVPAVQRAWTTRTACEQELESEGLFFRPPPVD